MNYYINKPTPAFIGVSWIALVTGTLAYGIGLFNADMMLNEKGYYLVLMLFGLFAAVSLQKSVRDKLENIPVTPIYFGLCWLSTIVAILFLLVGLWNAQLLLSEKGFYLMAFLMSLFGAVCVQKNVRDLEYLRVHQDQKIGLNSPQSVSQIKIENQTDE